MYQGESGVIQGKELRPPTPQCSSYWKGNLLVALDYGRQLYSLISRYFPAILVNTSDEVNFSCGLFNVKVLYSHLHVHSASQRHNTKDRCMKDNAWRKTQEDFFRKIFTSHFIARFEKGYSRLHVRGWWRLNINFIFWPHCYDRHVVSLLFSWCWGLLHWGFPRAPSVWCGLPYHISSLTLWKSAGNCIGAFRWPP